MLRSRAPSFVLAAALSFMPYAGEAQSVRATPLTSVSPAHCIDALAQRTTADPLRCPAALRSAIAEAQTVCREAGGTLVGTKEGDVWALDVNGDGRNELVFELDGNVTCEDAWSVFSCGSRGCPKALYELRDGTWVVAGHIAAQAPEQIALAKTGSGDHRTLEVCVMDGCVERWSYEWLGTSYEATRVEVRGTRVEIAGSIQGLHPLAVDTALLATPGAGATELDRYDAGTDVAIIGTAAGGDYFFVSPCNACSSGFVPRAAVALP